MAAKLGTIDVVVNNALYGQLGTLEELTDEEARKNFDVNVFGSLNVIRNVMPIFREKKSGAFFSIFNSGVHGYLSGLGYYNATKFAVAGFTEALSAETKSLGVTATIVILVTSKPTSCCRVHCLLLQVRSLNTKRPVTLRLYTRGDY